MAAPETCIVIGVDYGTTYTGAAFSVLTFVDGIPTPSVTKWITTWPGNRGAKKAPSQISYAAALGGQHQWGFDISPATIRIGLTKLRLEPQEKLQELRRLLQAVEGMSKMEIQSVNQSDGRALSYTKDPENIIADYLSHVREWLFDEFLVATYGAAFLASTPIDLVITVPAGWSEKAKDRILRAFRLAGFDKSNPDFATLRKTTLMLEPEAAALYTVRHLTDMDGDNTFRPGDCFILCDAGGGTVDLISYRILQIRPSLQLEEIGLATGKRCGAVFIDEAFQKWLKTIIGEEKYAMLLETSAESAVGSHTTITAGMNALMNSFEAVKRQFTGGTWLSSITLPSVLEIEDDSAKGISDGEIRITHQDLLGIFNPTVEQVLELLEGQYAQVRYAHLNVKHIFLSGGFGESPYLRAQVGEFARLRQIQLRKPEDAWLAVALGAVIKGIEEGSDLTSTGACRRHYGVSTSQPFSSFKHDESDAYIDPFDGEKKAGKQMTWLIRKGDPISSTEPKVAAMEICRKFGRGDSRVFKSTIVACEDSYAPERMADLHAGGIASFQIIYDLSRLPDSAFKVSQTGPKGVSYFSATLRIEFILQNDLLVRVTLNGEEISSTRGNYE